MPAPGSWLDPGRPPAGWPALLLAGLSSGLGPPTGLASAPAGLMSGQRPAGCPAAL
jgi:hypothetical protein